MQSGAFEPFWHKALLAVPRFFAHSVRSLFGVGEYDPASRRDGLCFVLILLSVLFIASEWVRVDGFAGRFAHSVSASIFGMMSIVLPVVLSFVAFRMIRNSGEKSGNGRVISGWVCLLISVCAIINSAGSSDSHEFNIEQVKKTGGLIGYVFGSPVSWGLSKFFAIVIYVVAAAFSVLLITGLHVTEIPDLVRKITGKSAGRANGETSADGVADTVETFESKSDLSNDFRRNSASVTAQCALPKAFQLMTETIIQKKICKTRPTLKNKSCLSGKNGSARKKCSRKTAESNLMRETCRLIRLPEPIMREQTIIV